MPTSNIPLYPSRVVPSFIMNNNVDIAQIKPKSCGAQIVVDNTGKAKQMNAPKLAEDATPSVNGVAKSLRNNVCISSPDTANAPPLNQAKVTRGSLKLCICALYSATPKCGASHQAAADKTARTNSNIDLFMRRNHYLKVI